MSPSFTRDFQPVLLWKTHTRHSTFVYGAITLYGSAFQTDSTKLRRRDSCGLHNTTSPVGRPYRVRFALFPFQSPLLGESLLVSFPPLTEMLHFSGFPLLTERHGLLARGRKSHSAILGSKATCAYPRLIAACHGLPRRPSQAIHQTAWACRVLLKSTRLATTGPMMASSPVNLDMPFTPNPRFGVASICID